MFIHDSLSELVVCGETDIVAADIRIIINQMMRQVAGDTETTGFQKEFQVMFVCVRAFESCMVYELCSFASPFPPSLPPSLPLSDSGEGECTVQGLLPGG